MWIVINTNKIAYKNLIGAQDSQKQEYVKITSAEEELITIWCDVVQGNVNFLFLIHIWYDLILHMYFWLSFQRISLTFHGYVLSVWYILFYFFCFLLGIHAWTSFPINCLWNCYKSQPQYQWKFSLFHSCLDHFHATIVSLVKLSKNFTQILWSCATYPVYFTSFWLGTLAWTSLPINCFWNCYKTQSKYQCVNWNSTYVEKM